MSTKHLFATPVVDGTNAPTHPAMEALREQLVAATPPEAREVRPPKERPREVDSEVLRAVLRAVGAPDHDRTLEILAAVVWAVPETNEAYAWDDFCRRIAGGDVSARDEVVLERIGWLMTHPDLANEAADYWKHGRKRPVLRGMEIPKCPAEAETVWRATRRRLRLRELRDQLFLLESKVLSLLGASAGLVLGTTKRLVGVVDRIDELFTHARARVDQEHAGPSGRRETPEPREAEEGRREADESNGAPQRRRRRPEPPPPID